MIATTLPPKMLNPSPNQNSVDWRAGRSQKHEERERDSRLGGDEYLRLLLLRVVQLEQGRREHERGGRHDKVARRVRDESGAHVARDDVPGSHAQQGFVPASRSRTVRRSETRTSRASTRSSRTAQSRSSAAPRRGWRLPTRRRRPAAGRRPPLRSTWPGPRRARRSRISRLQAGPRG